MDDKPADNKSSTAAFADDLVATFLGEIGTEVDEVGPFDCANAACCCFAATLACNAAASFSFRF
jgi:hypothetical protein